MKILKYLYYKIIGKGRHLKKNIICDSKWYGNLYGGFFVHPNLLNEKSIVYSFGIGEDISFDKAIIEKHHCQVFGFDPTPKSINWVAKQDLPSCFTFHDYGIDKSTRKVDFYLPKKSEHVSGSMVNQSNVSFQNVINVQMKSLKDILNELGHQKIDILKMDIEGSEYDVLESILDSDIPINQILIEFHERFFENGKSKTEKALKILRKNNFDNFAVSSSFNEVSFINKSLL